MSDTLKLEIPIDGDLLHKSKPKGIRSIVSTFPPLNKAKTTLKKLDPTEKHNQSEKEEIVVNRFVTSKCIGNGGFGEVRSNYRLQ